MEQIVTKGIRAYVFAVVYTNKEARANNDLLFRECEKLAGKQLNPETVTRTKRKLFQLIRDNEELYSKLNHILPTEEQQYKIKERQNQFKAEIKSFNTLEAFI